MSQQDLIVSSREFRSDTSPAIRRWLENVAVFAAVLTGLAGCGTREPLVVPASGFHTEKVNYRLKASADAMVVKVPAYDWQSPVEAPITTDKITVPGGKIVLVRGEVTQEHGKRIGGVARVVIAEWRGESSAPASAEQRLALAKSGTAEYAVPIRVPHRRGQYSIEISFFGDPKSPEFKVIATGILIVE